MKELFTNKYFILLLLVTVGLLVLTTLYTTERSHVSFFENVVASMVTPFQSLITATADKADGFFGYFRDVDVLKQENKEMKDEINSLSHALRRTEQYKTENDRLREMLDLRQSMEGAALVAAQVIGKDSGNWFRSFTIDKGTGDGLAVRQSVITSAGLVGHIYEIGTGWAKVLSIIDVNSSAGAIVVRTRDVAVVESDVDLQEQGLCKLTYLPKSSSVITGDLIETSGYGGTYPKGLLIGKIREIRPETPGISQYAIIEPAVDFERISEVFVMTGVPPSPAGE